MAARFDEGGYRPRRLTAMRLGATIDACGPACGAGGLCEAAAALQLSQAKHRSLAGHARIARRFAGSLCRSTTTTRLVSSAPMTRRRNRVIAAAGRFRPALRALPDALCRNDPAHRRSERTAFPICNSPPPIGCRSSSAAWCARTCRRRLHAIVRRRDRHRSRRQPLLRPDRLLRRQRLRLRLLQGVRSSAAPRACATLGPVLGPYHPVIAENMSASSEISGLDEVSFHMSGTEAVMQAVRLARYHTRRSHLVRFCGAYHGWWGDVQPGIGNPLPAHETYTLQDMSEDTLRVLRTRRDIACVLVNPLQALHPNARGAERFVAGRQRPRARISTRRPMPIGSSACARCARERNIVLIFDEVFVGFRLALGGAQEYFGVRADLVTYGKTLGGGLPIGVVCGRKRSDEAFPRRPPGRYLLCPRHVQLAPLRHGGDERISAAPRQNRRSRRSTAISIDLGSRAPRRSIERLRDAGSAGADRQSVVDLDGLLHAAFALQLDASVLSARGRPGIELGRHRPADLQPELYGSRLRAVADRFVTAAEAMQRGGWWWEDPLASNRQIKRRILREMIAHRLSPHWSRPVTSRATRPSIELQRLSVPGRSVPSLSCSAPQLPGPRDRRATDNTAPCDKV